MSNINDFIDQNTISQFIESLPKNPKEILFFAVLFFAIIISYKILKTFKKILTSLLLIGLIAGGIYFGYFNYIRKSVMPEGENTLTPAGIIKKTKEAAKMVEEMQNAKIKELESLKN